MIDIIMHGCNGAMGKVIVNLLNDDGNAKIIAGVDLSGESLADFPVYKNIKEVKEKADVIIDFAHVSAVDDLLDYVKDNKVPLVLCTTGLSKEQLEKVELVSQDVAILRSANMSLGVNVLLKLVKDAARILYKADFDIEIVEKHHRRKLDAPSGTALALADSINEALDNELSYIYERESRREKRNRKDLGISSIRGGSIVGEHEVIFAGEDELISINHSAYSRSIFAKGAVSAAKFLYSKKAGHYTMADLLNQA